MKKNIHDIDKIFKDALDDLHEPAPPAVWESLNNDLDKKQAEHFREKYYRVKRFAALLLLLIFSGTVYMIFFSTKGKKEPLATNENISVAPAKTNPLKQQGSSAPETAKENTRAEKQAAEKNETANELPSEKDAEQAAVINDNKTLDDNTTKEETIKAAPHSLHIKESAGKLSAATKKINPSAAVVKDAIIKNVPVAETKQPDQKNSFKNELSASNKKIKSSSYLAKNIKDRKYAGAGSNQDDANLKNENDFSAKNNNIIAKPGKDQVAKPGKNIQLVRSENSNQGENNIARSLSAYTYQPSLSLPGNVLFNVVPYVSEYPLVIDDSTAKSEQQKLVGAIAKKKATQANRFSLTAFVSPNHSFTRLEDDNQLSGPGHDKNEAERSETQSSSYSAGLLVNYGLSKHIVIQSGVVFSSAKTNIAGKTIYAKPDNAGHTRYEFNCSSGYSYITPKSGMPPAPGDSISVMGSSATINYIGVPVSVNYVVKAGRFLFKPGIGVAVNFLTGGNSATSFNIPSANQKEKETTPITGLRKAYLDGSFGVGMEYILNKRISISMRPLMRLALTSINKDTPVRTYQNFLSLETGLKINL